MYDDPLVHRKLQRFPVDDSLHSVPLAKFGGEGGGGEKKLEISVWYNSICTCSIYLVPSHTFILSDLFSSRMSFCLSSSLKPSPSTSLSSDLTARALILAGHSGCGGTMEGGREKGRERGRERGREVHVHHCLRTPMQNYMI